MFVKNFANQKKTSTNNKLFKKNLIDDVDVAAKSRWPLDKDAPYMKGPGLKL